MLLYAPFRNFLTGIFHFTMKILTVSALDLRQPKNFLFSRVEFVYIFNMRKLLAHVGKFKGLYLYFHAISKVDADTSTALAFSDLADFFCDMRVFSIGPQDQQSLSNDKINTGGGVLKLSYKYKG
jgi:hypothetical protein